MRNLSLTVCKLRRRHHLLPPRSKFSLLGFSLSLPPSLNLSWIQTYTVFRSLIVKSQKHCVWKAGTKWNLCFAKEMYQKCALRLSPTWCRLGIFSPFVMTLGSRVTSPGHLVSCEISSHYKEKKLLSAAQKHILEPRNAQMLMQYIRNSRYLQGVTVWGTIERNAEKTLLPEKKQCWSCWHKCLRMFWWECQKTKSRIVPSSGRDNLLPGQVRQSCHWCPCERFPNLAQPQNKYCPKANEHSSGMNKQFAATITDTHTPEAEAKNKSRLGGTVLSSLDYVSSPSRNPTLPSQISPPLATINFPLYLLLGYGNGM